MKYWDNWKRSDKAERTHKVIQDTAPAARHMPTDPHPYVFRRMQEPGDFYSIVLQVVPLMIS